MYRIEWVDSEVKLLLAERRIESLQQEPHISRGLEYRLRGPDIQIQGPLLREESVGIRLMDRNGVKIPWMTIQRREDEARFGQPNRDSRVEIYSKSNGQVLDEFASIAPAHHLPGRIYSLTSSSEDADWQRLRNLCQQLLGPLGPKWKETARQMGPGISRCLILKHLGAEFVNTFDAARELRQGHFRDHFPRYWKQLSLLYSSLQDDRDWSWASPFLSPPAGEAYK